jgi:hypothetical protein
MYDDSTTNILENVDMVSQKTRSEDAELDEFETGEENYYDKMDFDPKNVRPNKVTIFQEK